jgi:hypothetical protein
VPWISIITGAGKINLLYPPNLTNGVQRKSLQSSLRFFAVIVLLLAAGTEFVWRGPVRLLFHGYQWNDVSQVYVMSKAWLWGINPYDPYTFVGVCKTAMGSSPRTSDIRTHSPYPISTLVIMAPLSQLSWKTAHVVWALFLGLTILPMVLALASFGQIPDRYHLTLFAAMALALAPLHTGIAAGNVSIPAIALCCVAVWAGGGRKEVLAGILLGIASCLKPQMGICFLFYYFLRKRWRIALVASTIAAAVVGVGILRLEISGVRWLQDFLNNSRAFSTVSPTVDFTEADPIRFTLLNLQVLFYSLSRDAVLAQAGAWLTGIALIGTWLWIARRGELTRVPELLVISSLLIISLLPAYHRNYEATLLIFPLCWAISEFSEHEQRPRKLARWAVVLMLPFAIPGPTLLQHLVNHGRVPMSLTKGWWWEKLIMPHEIWLLLILSIVLLYSQRASAKDRKRQGESAGASLKPCEKRSSSTHAQDTEKETREYSLHSKRH